MTASLLCILELQQSLAYAVSIDTTLGAVKDFSVDTLLLFEVSRNPEGVDEGALSS